MITLLNALAPRFIARLIAWLFDRASIGGLQNAVRTNARTNLQNFWFLFAQRGMEKKQKNKKRQNFQLTYWKDLKFQPSVCADIHVTRL